MARPRSSCRACVATGWSRKVNVSRGPAPPPRSRVAHCAMRNVQTYDNVPQPKKRGAATPTFATRARRPARQGVFAAACGGLCSSCASRVLHLDAPAVVPRDATVAVRLDRNRPKPSASSPSCARACPCSSASLAVGAKVHQARHAHRLRGRIAPTHLYSPLCQVRPPARPRARSAPSSHGVAAASSMPVGLDSCAQPRRREACRGLRLLATPRGRECGCGHPSRGGLARVAYAGRTSRTRSSMR